MCLYLLIFLPLLGGIFSWISEKINKKLPCLVSLFFIFSMFILILKIFFRNGIILYKNINLSTLWDTEYCISWIPILGVSFHLGIDGISFLMIFLTIFLSFISILLTWNEDIKKNGFFYFCIMLIISNMMGIFLSLDLFLFFIFWEIIIIPTYFIVLFYGKYNKYSLKQLHSSNSYLIYSQLSGLILLISILTLVFNYYQQYHIFTFDFNLLKNISLDKNIEILLMIGFFLSFAIKVPFIPFHSWFPNFHKNTHISGSFDLIGIVIKIAIYSLFRFNIFLFPKMSTYYSIIFCIFGLFSIFYSLFIMFSQKNLKKIISYMSISHMGFVLIAMYSGSYIAYQGMIIQMISSSLSTSALIILTKILYKNFKTYNLNKMIGLWNVMSYVPGFFLFFFMASLGIPGTGNFIGEFLILLGSFKFFPIIIILSMISIIFLSFCLLNFFHKMFYGFYKTTFLIYKISILEIFILFILAFILIFIGLYPNIILKIANPSIFNISKRISPFILN